ncbi:AsmA family protein [Actibacterium ureilyticum]|uniref:AsmA family protein n=1 Tax=Actibacterium ureilyticum TaxID=1590614 RepID=UPI001595EBDD|nr:AsmA family protein [Actibacterium ureilyticum]
MRWLLRFLLSLVILAVLLIGGLFLLPADKIAGLASEQLRAATGRDVTLTGRLAPTVWPQLGVSTGPVTLSNASWSEAGPMLRAKGLSVGLDASALIGGQIKIRKLELRGPQIILEKAADGRVNWDLAVADAAAQTVEPGGTGTGGAAKSSAPTEFSIDQAEISDATLRFIDHAAGTETRIDGLTARITAPEFTGPADLSVQATLNGQPMQAEAHLDQLAALLVGQVSGMKLDLSLGETTLDFAGRGGLEPLAAEGQMSLKSGDLAGVFAALGQPAPELPADLAKGLSLSGGLTYAPAGSVHLRQAVLRAGSNQLAGDADLTLDGKPRLTGSFTTDALDLSPFMADTPKGGSGGNGGGGGKKSAGGWSTDPIDVSALAALDAEVALDAGSVDLGDTKLGRTRILATLTDRRLVLTLREVRAHDGLLTGEFVVNGRGGLSVGGDLNAQGVGMQSLLSELAGFDRLLGAGNLQLNFLGSGNSMDAIMKSLKGDGKFSVGKGELRGLDLAGMLRNLDTSYEGQGAKTIFDSIGASFAIRDGVLRNKDLSLLAPLLQAVGLGKVDLGGQTLDYRVTPTAFSGADDEGVKVPLLITGTWASPKFKLDLKALAEQELELERRKQELEDRAKAETEKAKARAEKQVGKKLGVKAEDGESLEDAAKRQLRDEAKKSLRKLFD